MTTRDACLIAGLGLIYWSLRRAGRWAREVARRLDIQSERLTLQSRRLDAWESETARLRKVVEFHDHYTEGRIDDVTERLGRVEARTVRSWYDPVRDLDVRPGRDG